MIRPLMRMTFFLRQPSEPAGPEDLAVAQDLADTLEAHRATCAGMAANMIGQHKRIIAVMDDRGTVLTMLNPQLIWGKEPYETVEGCLSLEGTRATSRYRRIKVSWEDTSFGAHSHVFTGPVAQAIQHEIDHCDGILI